MPGVIPCIVMRKGKMPEDILHRPFVTSQEEEMEFSRYLPEYSGGAIMWVLCQLYNLEEYASRGFGDILNGEVQQIITTNRNNDRQGIKRYIIYSSQGSIPNVTQPGTKFKSGGDPNDPGKEVLYVQYMGIPFSISGKRKSVVQASKDLDHSDPKILEEIGRFIKGKLSTDVIAGDPVFDDDLMDFLSAIADGIEKIPGRNHEEEHPSHGKFPLNMDHIRSPPEDTKGALLHFFFLSGTKCPDCGRIHEEDAEITGIKTENQWNQVFEEYFTNLVKRKEEVLKILSTDQEILRQWPEAADSLRNLLLGNFRV